MAGNKAWAEPSLWTLLLDTGAGSPSSAPSEVMQDRDPRASGRGRLAGELQVQRSWDSIMTGIPEQQEGALAGVEQGGEVP